MQQVSENKIKLLRWSISWVESEIDDEQWGLTWNDT